MKEEIIIVPERAFLSYIKTSPKTFARATCNVSMTLHYIHVINRYDAMENGINKLKE